MLTRKPCTVGQYCKLNILNLKLNILFHRFIMFYLFFFVCFCSSIHDHADAHCFLKVLDGRLKETQYPWPSESEPEKPLEPTSSRFYETDEVNYINGMSKTMIYH